MEQSAPQDNTGKATPPPSSPTPPAPTTGFDFNRPTIVALLDLSSAVLGVTALIGVVLGYVWRNEPHEAWEESHFRYLINTFWLGLVGSIVSVLLMIVAIGFVLLPAVAVLVIIRCVLSLVKAQQHEPMPNPDTWIA